MKLIIKLLITALALLAVAYLVPGVAVTSFYTALIVAIVLGLLNLIKHFDAWLVYICY